MVDSDGNPNHPTIGHDPPTWRRSRHGDTAEGGVECALTADAVGIRNSRHPDGPILTVDHDSWRRFVEAIKAGDFDRGGHG